MARQSMGRLINTSTTTATASETATTSRAGTNGSKSTGRQAPTDKPLGQAAASAVDSAPTAVEHNTEECGLLNGTSTPSRARHAAPAPSFGSYSLRTPRRQIDRTARPARSPAPTFKISAKSGIRAIDSPARPLPTLGSPLIPDASLPAHVTTPKAAAAASPSRLAKNRQIKFRVVPVRPPGSNVSIGTDGIQCQGGLEVDDVFGPGKCQESKSDESERRTLNSDEGERGQAIRGDTQSGPGLTAERECGGYSTRAPEVWARTDLATGAAAPGEADGSPIGPVNLSSGASEAGSESPGQPALSDLPVNTSISGTTSTDISNVSALATPVTSLLALTEDGQFDDASERDLDSPVRDLAMLASASLSRWRMPANRAFEMTTTPLGTLSKRFTAGHNGQTSPQAGPAAADLSEIPAAGDVPAPSPTPPSTEAVPVEASLLPNLSDMAGRIGINATGAGFETCCDGNATTAVTAGQQAEMQKDVAGSAAKRRKTSPTTTLSPRSRTMGSRGHARAGRSRMRHKASMSALIHAVGLGPPPLASPLTAKILSTRPLSTVHSNGAGHVHFLPEDQDGNPRGMSRPAAPAPGADATPQSEVAGSTTHSQSAGSPDREDWSIDMDVPPVPGAYPFTFTYGLNLPPVALPASTAADCGAPATASLAVLGSPSKTESSVDTTSEVAGSQDPQPQLTALDKNRSTRASTSASLSALEAENAALRGEARAAKRKLAEMSAQHLDYAETIARLEMDLKEAKRAASSTATTSQPADNDLPPAAATHKPITPALSAQQREDAPVPVTTAAEAPVLPEPPRPSKSNDMPTQAQMQQYETAVRLAEARQSLLFARERMGRLEKREKIAKEDRDVYRQRAHLAEREVKRVREDMDWEVRLMMDEMADKGMLSRYEEAFHARRRAIGASSGQKRKKGHDATAESDPSVDQHWPPAGPTRERPETEERTRTQTQAKTQTPKRARHA